MKVSFGFNLPTFTGGYGLGYNAYHVPDYLQLDWELSKRAVIECENLGFDSVWVCDHLILGGGPIYEAFVTMTALAAITRSMRVGTLVLCPAFRHPSVLAKMVATLDQVSGGRLDFGIGAGWNDDEAKAYGIPWDKPSVRIKKMEETIEIVKRMWTVEKPTFKGKYFSITEATCDPKPIQKPHPPIWIGGGGEKHTLRVVAKHADGWTGGGNIQMFKHKLEVLQRHCEQVGRNFKEIKLACDTFVFISRNADERGALLKKFAESLMVDPIFTKWGRVRPVTEDWAKELFIYGSPEECIQKIYEYNDLGVSLFQLWFPNWPSMESVRLFAEEVINEL